MAIGWVVKEEERWTSLEQEPLKSRRSVSQERGRPHVGCVSDLEGEVKGWRMDGRWVIRFEDSWDSKVGVFREEGERTVWQWHKEGRLELVGCGPHCETDWREAVSSEIPGFEWKSGRKTKKSLIKEMLSLTLEFWRTRKRSWIGVRKRRGQSSEGRGCQCEPDSPGRCGQPR